MATLSPAVATSRRSTSRRSVSQGVFNQHNGKERVDSGELELSEVQRELSDVVDWYTLGVHLKVPAYNLKVFEKAHPGDVERCKLDTLEHWMDNSDDVSWGRLADALSHVGGYARIVRSLRQKEAAAFSNVTDFARLLVPVSPGDSQSTDQRPLPSKGLAGMPPSPISEITSTVQAEGDGRLRTPAGGDNADSIHSLVLTESEESSESLESWKLPEVLTADQLEVETHRIQTTFNILFTKSYQALEEKGVSVEQLVFFLQGQSALEPVSTADHRPVLGDEIFTLRKARSIMEVFGVLRSYCSFFNHILLFGIIDMYCQDSAAVQQAKDKFMHHLKHYYKQRVCDCPKTFLGIVKSKNASKVKMKIDKQWATIRVSQLAFLRDSIAHALRLKRYTLFLCAAERGCFLVTFSVPEFVVDGVFLALSAKQKAELFELGVTSVTCRGVDNALSTSLNRAPALVPKSTKEKSHSISQTHGQDDIATASSVTSLVPTFPDQEEFIPLELLVKQPHSKSSFTLTLPPSEQLRVSEYEERSTAIAFLSYLGETSLNDSRLSEAEAKLLYLRPVTERKDDIHAAQVGMVYGSIKNDSEIDRLRQEVADSPDVRCFIELYIENAHSEEASNVIVECFALIARGVFQCDEKGIATHFSPGRIIALFCFSYEICIAFLRHHSVLNFLDFLARLVAVLIQFLTTSHFYEWLQEQGGWLTLLGVSTGASRRLGLVTGAVVGLMAVAAVYWAVRRLAS